MLYICYYNKEYLEGYLKITVEILENKFFYFGKYTQYRERYFKALGFAIH